MILWIQGNSRFRSITHHLDHYFSIWFVFRAVLLILPKLNVSGIPAQRQFKWEKFESYNYVIKRKSGSCNCSNQQLNGWISWITKFICLGIDISDHLYSRSVFSKQIVPNKWNVLSQSRALAFPKKLFYLLQWKLFKNYEKCFLFHVKSSFHSQDN